MIVVPSGHVQRVNVPAHLLRVQDARIQLDVMIACSAPQRLVRSARTHRNRSVATRPTVIGPHEVKARAVEANVLLAAMANDRCVHYDHEHHLRTNEVTRVMQSVPAPRGLSRHVPLHRVRLVRVRFDRQVDHPGATTNVQVLVAAQDRGQAQEAQPRIVAGVAVAAVKTVTHLLLGRLAPGLPHHVHLVHGRQVRATVRRVLVPVMRHLVALVHLVFRIVAMTVDQIHATIDHKNVSATMPEHGARRGGASPATGQTRLTNPI